MGKRSSLKLINDALALSAHVLARDNSQLPAQLFGRLNNSAPDDVMHLLYQAEAAQRGPWLKPITSSLARPGGSLNRTLGDGGTEPVISVALTLDGLHAIAGGAKGNLTVWDLGRGERIQTIHAHNDAVNAISITPDGDRVVSASADGVIKVWELGTGLLLQSLSSPSPVKIAAMVGSGKYLVSGSQSRLLNVWDLHEARLVRELEDEAEIEAMGAMPDGRSVIYSCRDVSESMGCHKRNDEPKRAREVSRNDEPKRAREVSGLRLLTFAQSFLKQHPASRFELG